MNSNLNRSGLLRLAILAALGFQGVAHAEEPASGLEEITVTAQRRTESLQDIPISVTALSAEALETRGITGIGSLTTGQVPALRVLDFGGLHSTPQMTIRGIGETDPSPSLQERPVAVYVDGVYLARAQGSNLELTDYDSIEILRGPQGTLFGRNAVGGAVNITSKKPTGEFGLKQIVEYGNYDTLRARTTVNLPEVANVAVTGDFLYSSSDGWIENVDGDHNFNYYLDRSYRIAARWKVVNDITVDYAYDHLDTNWVQNLATNFRDPSGLVPAPSISDRPDKTYTTLEDSPVRETTWGHTFTLNAPSDTVNFKLIGSYRELETGGSSKFSGCCIAFDIGGDGVISPDEPYGAGYLGGQDTTSENYSLEAQVFGNTDRIDWIAGAYYFSEDIHDDFYNGFSQLAVNGAPLLTFDDPVWFGNNSIIEASTEAKALYGQMTWTPPVLDDHLFVTVGARYSDDNKDGCRLKFGGVDVPQGGMCFETSTSRVDPLVALRYEWSSSLSAYARYSTAYRGGGASSRDTTGLGEFSEDEVEAIEVGVKSLWLDNRLRANVALFHNKFNDFQVSVQNVANNPQSTAIVNSLDSNTFEGVELDTEALLTDDLRMTFSYQYLDASPITINNPVIPTQEIRLFPQQAPEHSGSVGFDYTLPDVGIGRLDFHVDYSFSTDFLANASAGFAPKPDFMSYEVVNARVTLSDLTIGDAGNLKLALYAKNLLDADYPVFQFIVPTAGPDPIQERQYAPPRTYGIGVTYEF